METMNFTININASKEKVWDALWSDANYRKWTAVFSEGSYAETDWEEGSEIRFLSPGGDGMYSIIQKKVPLEQMVFAHQGELKNRKVENKDWAGAKEAYYLQEKNGITELKVQMDATAEFKDYFTNTFPKALAVVKQIAEQA